MTAAEEVAVRALLQRCVSAEEAVTFGEMLFGASSNKVPTKRTRAEAVADREARVARARMLRAEGWSLTRIAHEVGWSHSYVSVVTKGALR